MINFKNFNTAYLLDEEISRGFIKSSGAEAIRHHEKYIKPYIGSETPTHTLGKEHGELEAGTQVKIHGTEDVKGKAHVLVSTGESDKTHLVPVSKLHKPGEVQSNKGFDYENNFIEHMKRHSIMPKEVAGAGFSGGTDFVIQNPKNKSMQRGRVKAHENLFHGETKKDTTAAMGQLTIRFHPDKGWHIPDDAREKRPQYAKAIENAGILDHMNKHYHPDTSKIETTASGRAKSIVLKHPNLDPAESYLQDHHVHVLQVGSGYGTYRVGKKDATGHGFPRITGKGKWTIREKQAGNKNARTVMFQPDGVKGLDKSHINLDDEEHVKSFKKTLGIS